MLIMEIKKNILICRVEGDAGGVRESHNYFFRSCEKNHAHERCTCCLKVDLEVDLCEGI